MLLKAGCQCHFAESFGIFTERLLPRMHEESVEAEYNG